MISSYRLGDLVCLSLNQDEKNAILAEHPNSIGSEYISGVDHNIDLITAIVLKRIDMYKDLFPKDIEESTVIHLRLGDVVGGNEWHEKIKRPLDIDYLKLIVPDSKVYIIGKCFFAKGSSNNFEECTDLSRFYLENVISALNAEHFDGGDADIDLCLAVKSKCFIQGRGFFSKLITDIRKKLNLKCICTEVCT